LSKNKLIRFGGRVPMVEISYSKKIPREKLAELISTITDILRKGEGTLNLDEYSMSIEIPDEVSVEIEYEMNKDTQKLEIEVEWGAIKEEGVEEAIASESSEEEQKVEEYSTAPIDYEEEIEEKEIVADEPEVESESSVELEDEIVTAETEDEIKDDTDERMKDILQQLSEQMQEASKSVDEGASQVDESIEPEEGQADEGLKPDGNIFEISEAPVEEAAEEIEPEITEEETIEPEDKIPVYDSETEEKIVEKVESSEESIEPETKKEETENDLGSTADLQKILETLKKSKLDDTE
jgi:amphi-Trp domain-containing protein